jgi:hypothetical protein
MNRLAVLAAVIMAMSLTACSDDGNPPNGNPAASLKKEMRGYEAPIGVMMGLNETPYWVQSALAEYRAVDVEEDVPADFEYLAPNDSCSFALPNKDEKLAKVQVDGSLMKGPVFVASKDEIGDATRQYIANVQHMGEDAPVPVNQGDGQLGVVDVVVTETSKPVYLVISYDLPTLFNVHLADGARLSRIALIGLGTSGIANVDKSVPIRSLTGRAMAGCGVAPLRAPADHWLFIRNVQEDSSLQGHLDKNIAEARAYSTWYRSNFGTGSEPDAIGASMVSHVLVGPLPESLDKRVTYRPLAEATVRLTRNDLVHGGLEEEFMARKKELITEAATKFAGGDLGTLKLRK